MSGYTFGTASEARIVNRYQGVYVESLVGSMRLAVYVPVTLNDDTFPTLMIADARFPGDECHQPLESDRETVMWLQTLDRCGPTEFVDTVND